jgi:hypothetical protein
MAKRGYGPEADIQKAVLQELAITCPEASALIIHIPNEGRRSPRTGKHLKDMGMRPGVSDLFLPIARGKYHGLWIEVKAPKKKPTPTQKDWLNSMVQQDYCCTWGDNAAELCEYIRRYMKW